MSTRLFDGGSDESDNDLSLGTNKDYAKSYNKFRQKELLKKFKDRGQAVSESDSSSDSESSEDEEVLDPKFDQEFFKTLASLKSKDPVIYDKNKKFFDGVGKFNADDDDDEADVDADGSFVNKSTQKEKKMKPVTLKDYERKVMLEKGGKYEDDSEYEDNEEPLRSASPTLVEEERRLKAEFRNVMNADEESDDGEAGFGGIFKKREKSKQETAREEEDFAKWLAGKKEDIQEEDKQRLEPLKNYWSSSKLPQSERFLRDYILNKGYANTNFSDIPTYDEIVGDNAPLSEDEEELEKQAEFEHKYNFRFEEPDAEFITRYPRTIENSVRRTDDKRKQKRVETKERKQQEKQQQMRELEIVREMKRKEIADKIEKLKLVTGNDEVGFKDDELEEDFDPEAHDRRMQEIFDDDYYQVNEGEEKPECPSDIDELKIEDWDNYDPHKSYGNDDDDYTEHCEDDDFNMDCDYDPAAAKEQLQQELIENTRGRKGRKGRRNRFMEMIQSEKPAFDPEDERTYAEYIDEYYKMDCEDIIGDVPCRFKYVETTPNDFGLSIEEILLAKNKELNQWASLKKAIQIRPDYVEKKEQRLYKMKSKNEDLKRKIFKSLYGDGSDEEPEENEISNIAANSEVQKTNESVNIAGETVATATVSKKKRKRKAQAAQAQSNTDEGSAQQLDAKPEIENDDVTAAKKPKEELENTAESETISKTNVEQVAAVNGETVAAKKKRNKKKKKKPAANQNEVVGNTTTTDTAQTKSAPQTKPTNAATNPFGSGGGGNNKKTFKGKVGGGNTTNSAPTLPKKPPFNGAVGKNPFGSAGAKSNNKPVKAGNDSKAAPTIRKNAVGAAGKFKNKFKNKDADSKISDERLKAYGINPRKFHKQQKYGGKKED